MPVIQSEYPACHIHHNPEYWCCEYTSTIRLLYTKYTRPEGGEYGVYYKHGWNVPRRVDYPHKMYTPLTPTFQYTNSSHLCRLSSIFQPDGTLNHTMQCTFPSTSFQYNQSLARYSNKSTEFWTFPHNPRNNNASFPLNAKCYSLTQPNGTLNITAKNECTFSPPGRHYRYSSMYALPLATLYVFLITTIGLVCIWFVTRHIKAHFVIRHSILRRSQSPSKSTRPPLDTMLISDKAFTLQEQMDIMAQTGYSNSSLGNFVLYASLTTVGIFNVALVLLVSCNNGGFAHRLFDPNLVLIKSFILLWILDAVSLSLLIFYRSKINNLFRYITPLESCECVHISKRAHAQANGSYKNRSWVSLNIIEETVQVRTTLEGDRFIELEHFRYIYDEFARKFVPGVIVLPDTIHQLHAEGHYGLTTRESQRRIDILGPNTLHLRMPSLFQLFLHELGSLFNVYQLLCYFVWFFTGYVGIALLNICVIIAVLVRNIITKRHRMSTVAHLTCHQTDHVSVLRDGTWKSVSCLQLVPGDLIRVVHHWKIPCDMVLLRGSIVCDESALTGESMPVQKFSIPNEPQNVFYYPNGNGKKHTLFAGTKTLTGDQEIVALVYFTRAQTCRGQLVQTILSPCRLRFKYEEELQWIIGVLAGCGLACAYLAMWFLSEGVVLESKYFTFIYGVFMFSAVLNPLLPVVLTAGQIQTGERLLRSGVYCLEPARLPLCGIIQVFCFDKTGTITEQGLHFRAILPVVQARFTQAKMEIDVTLRFAMASCHSVAMVDGALAGDDVEVEMFKHTGWELIQDHQNDFTVSPDRVHELQVIKRFEFDHERMSMSVVVLEKSTGKYFVFCKGSYEKMQTISISESIPCDYRSIAQESARNGLYVLGIAYKCLELETLDLLCSDRNALEEGLTLLGLMLFQNELKKDSRRAVLALKDGNIRPVMLTGDNSMTSCSIARAGGILEPHAQVILADIERTSGGMMLVWRDIDTEAVFTTEQVRLMVARSEESILELAVTGSAFEALKKLDWIDQLLFRIRIFSRMTPASKADCVERYVRAGAVTGMCGDGGNDCGALRAAHVGLALTRSKTCVVAPFTSSNSIQSVVTLCLEGRATLANYCASLRFVILYGLIGIGFRFVMYSSNVFIGQLAFTFSDGVILMGLFYGIIQCRPHRTLGKERSSSTLLGAPLYFSLVGQMLIHVCFLGLSVHHLTTQPWYCPFAPDRINLIKWWELQDSHLSTCLWMTACFQQMASGLSCCLGAHFRRPMWNNGFLWMYTTFVFAFLGILFLGEPTALTDSFRVASSTNVIGLPNIPLPFSYRCELFGIGVANLLVCFLYEKVFVLGLIQKHVGRG
uniref:Cationtransporting ATPase putative n=1 Tax=Albugo laibachii Nc14 TaxID=890382 RepID=F0WRI8_9STRA|nr:cationtransporting ATPase putative [Albugo laibachii Nc14]|eukprot:CCA23951.1 cationtransporting ATPase putative [Albugo laibachii Nc14]